MNETVLKFQNVSVIYPNGFCAVRGVNFEIKPGECLAIVGESGSGKTTIAHAALGLLPSETKISGSILVGETEIVGAAEKTLRDVRGLTVGFVAQEPFSSFNPLTRIYNHISEAWRVHARRPPPNFIVESLEKFGIADAKNLSRNYPRQWSGGMLQRATIVAAKANQPQLVVADEPTSALDASRADEILSALCAGESTVLLVSHDIALTAKYANRLAVCYRGEIVEIGDTAQVIENPQHFYTKSLLEAVSFDKKFHLESDSASDEIVLEAKNLSRDYQNKSQNVRAVARADLRIRRGEIVGIYGDSGCGKSTLLRLLAAIETPSGGEVYLGGELATDGKSQKLLNNNARKGFVLPIFQDPLSSLDARWAIWRIVSEPLMAKHRAEKFSRAERRAIAAKILAEVGLREIDLEARPKELSIGQCQRICIARALVARPALIVADEPTSALDASVSKTILQLFARIAERGTAVLIVSHDERMLRSACRRVLRMSDGVVKG